MTVTEALAARHSFRAFLPTPVEADKLRAILEAAQRAPSWANSQPWEVFVAAGNALDRIKAGYAEKYAAGALTDPESPRPAKWTDIAVERRTRLHPTMQLQCGEAAEQFGKLNQIMFNAPAVIYICMDKDLSEWSMYDIGAYSQSLMLAAIQYGLGSIPSITLTHFPDVLHKELGIPDNYRVTIGIATGYADRQNRINDFVSERDSVDKVVRIPG